MDAACKPASGAQGRNGTEFSTPGSECVLPLALKYFNAKALISGNNWKLRQCTVQKKNNRDSGILGD